MSRFAASAAQQTLQELSQSPGPPGVVNPVMLTSMWTGGKNTVDTWVKITEEAKTVAKSEFCIILQAESTGELMSHKSSCSFIFQNN